MTIDQVIAAQEAAESAALNGLISFAQMKARLAELEKAKTAAMVQIIRRIAREEIERAMATNPILTT